MIEQKVWEGLKGDCIGGNLVIRFSGSFFYWLKVYQTEIEWVWSIMGIELGSY